MTSREIVRRALRFETPSRLPRDMWALPWAEEHLAEGLKELRRRFPSDFSGPGCNVYRPSPRVKGDWYAVGEYVDDWGCTFTNIHKGVIGEVKESLVQDLDGWRKLVVPPVETLPADYDKARDEVNRACAASDKFILTPCCPRPWERYQFLRGTANSLMDMAELSKDTTALIRFIHEYYLKELEFWGKTDVDAITFMDDWGSQQSLLINPVLWRELFKPLYKDYCDFAHSHGKFIFMHSDGHIQSVYPDIVEIGVDALNSQLFCMDIAELGRIAKGRLTFWGEIDRQHVLPAKDPQVGRDAVRQVAKHLYDPRGGVIAQFELTPGSNSDTAIAIYEEWEKIDAARGISKK